MMGNVMVGDAGLGPVVPLNMGQMVANYVIAFKEITVTAHQTRRSMLKSM